MEKVILCVSNKGAGMQDVLQQLWGSFHKKAAATKATETNAKAKPIACDRQALHDKITMDAFDGGRTADWMRSLPNAKWFGIRDTVTGHEIHAVSDRQIPMADLYLGLRLMSWMTQTQPLRWYWWDQPWVRLLPADTDPGRDHINGGWAVVGVPEVHVYRREEAHKVLLHECIHALRLDVDTVAADHSRLQFEAVLGRSLWPHLGEAWTEMRAELLWAVASSPTAASANRAWIRQKRCAAGQAAQVWARIRDSTRAEDTNVFAYYILKWVLMGHELAVVLAPDASVAHWFRWWQEALPFLNAAASKKASSEKHVLALGMTCPSG